MAFKDEVACRDEVAYDAAGPALRTRSAFRRTPRTCSIAYLR